MKVPPADDGDVYLGGIRVLVVDGSHLVRATVTAMLEHYGAAVTAVASADKALEVYTKLREATSLEVNVTRRGKPVTLKYSIR